MQTLLSDLRYAFRGFRRSPALPILTVVALSLGIGANTAVYSAIDALVFRAHRMPDVERVVQVWDRYPSSDPTSEVQISVSNFEDYAAQQTVFDRFAAFQPGSGYVELGGRYQSTPVLTASHDLLSILGARPVLGRDFRPEESIEGTERVVLISHDVWQESFAGASDAIGRAVDLTLWSQKERGYVARPYEVIGVLPEGFKMPRVKLSENYVTPPTPSFIFPLGLWEWGRGNRGMYAFRSLGRLAPGRQLAEARTEMAGIASQIAQAYPATNKGYTVVVTPLRELARDAYGQQMFFLWGAALLLLLIACANVAALLIGQAVAREQEYAVRKAMGAEWSRILRYLLTESGALALAGGIGGIVVALLALNVLDSVAPAEVTGLQEAGLDLRVLVFAVAASALTVLLFGVGPSLAAARLDINRSLKTGGRAGSKGGLRAIQWLVTGQVALAFVLLTSGGLLLVSFANMINADAGFEPEGRYLVRTAAFVPGLSKYSSGEDRTRLFGRIEAAVGAVPGVLSIAYTDVLPLNGRQPMADISPADRPLIPPEARRLGEWMRVSEGYFATMGIPVLEGREFRREDRSDEPGGPIPTGQPLPERPILISDALARLYWPDESALDQILYWGIQDPAVVVGGSYETGWDVRYPQPFPLRVIGVVGNVNQIGMDDEPRFQFYTLGDWNQRLVLHARGEPAALLPQLRSAVEGVDSELEVIEAVPYSQRIDAVAAGTRFQLFLVSVFAVLSTVMAVFGLFGIMGYSVRQRMHEIGIRMSIGATGAQIRAMILAQGARMIGVGIVLGVFGAWASGRVLRGVLFGVEPTAPTILSGAVVVMALAGLAGCIPPTRRAARVDPVAIIRSE